MARKNVLILDDHTLFLQGMSLILKECCSDCEVKTFQSIRELLESKINFEDYNLLISDIEFPGEDVFELFTFLREKFPMLPVLVVSMHKKNAIIKKCKALNIDGYLLKDEDDELIKAIETILKGDKYYSKGITSFCNKTRSSYKRLTERETDIIKLIVGGYNNQEIADKLFISIETVKTHKKNIKIKLDIDNNFGIIDYAKKNFLL